MATEYLINGRWVGEHEAQVLMPGKMYMGDGDYDWDYQSMPSRKSLDEIRAQLSKSGRSTKKQWSHAKTALQDLLRYGGSSASGEAADLWRIANDQGNSAFKWLSDNDPTTEMLKRNEANAAAQIARENGAGANDPGNAIIRNWQNYSIPVLKTLLTKQQLAMLPSEALSQFSNEDLLAIDAAVPGFIKTLYNLLPVGSRKSSLAPLVATSSGGGNGNGNGNGNGSNPPPLPGGTPNTAPLEAHDPNFQTRTGSADNLFAGGFQRGNLNDSDIARLFPFAEDPDTSADRLLQGYGFDMNISNPYTDWMRSELPKRMSLLRLRNILGGRDYDPAALLTQLTSGAMGADQGGPDILTGLKDLVTKYRANDPSLSQGQRGEGEFLVGGDTRGVYDEFMRSQRLDPRFLTNNFLTRNYQNTLRRYQNAATGQGANKTYWDFLTGNF